MGIVVLVFIALQGVGMSFLAAAMFSLFTSYLSANRVAEIGLVNLCFELGSLLGHRIANARGASVSGGETNVASGSKSVVHRGNDHEATGTFD